MQNHILLTAKTRISFAVILLSALLVFGCGKNTPTVPTKPTPPPLSQRFSYGIYRVTLHEVFVNNTWQLKVINSDDCENDQYFTFSTFPTDYVQMTNKCVDAGQSPHWAWVIDNAAGTLTLTDENNNVVASGPLTVEDDNHYIIFTNTHAQTGIPERYTMFRDAPV